LTAAARKIDQEIGVPGEPIAVVADAGSIELIHGGGANGPRYRVEGAFARTDIAA